MLWKYSILFPKKRITLIIFSFCNILTISGTISTSMPSSCFSSSGLCHVSTGFSIKLSVKSCVSLCHSTSFCFLGNSWSSSFKSKWSNVFFYKWLENTTQSQISKVAYTSSSYFLHLMWVFILRINLHSSTVTKYLLEVIFFLKKHKKFLLVNPL